MTSTPYSLGPHTDKECLVCHTALSLMHESRVAIYGHMCEREERAYTKKTDGMQDDRRTASPPLVV